MNNLSLCLKVTVFIVGILLSGCGYFVSKDDVIAWANQTVRNEIASHPEYEGLTIHEIVLIRESSSTFTGLVMYRFGKETENVSLTVTVDGDKRMFKSDAPRGLILKAALCKTAVGLDSEMENAARQQLGFDCPDVQLQTKTGSSGTSAAFAKDVPERCKGSYELDKCVESERQPARETEEQKDQSREKLEEKSQSTLAFVHQNRGQENVENDPIVTPMQTEGGILKVIGRQIYQHALVLENKVLIDGAFSLHIGMKYSMPGVDVIVIEKGTGANNACSIEYYLFTVKREGVVNRSPAIICHHEAELEINDRTFSKISGIIGGDKVDFDYKTGVLKINGEIIRE